MKLLLNNAPDLKPVKMMCDVELSPKLKEFPMLDNHFNKYNTSVFIGGMGSGKTSLMVNFVKDIYKKVFDKIYLIMPPSSRASLQNNLFEKNLPRNQIYDELNEDVINDLFQKVEVNTSKGLKSLIIYDDVQRALKDKYVLKTLKMMILNQRHLKTTNFIMLQNWFGLDLSLREVINNAIIFKVGKRQSTKIFEELVEVDKDVFQDIVGLVFEKQYDWLMININEKRMYKKFDEIVFETEDDED